MKNRSLKVRVIVSFFIPIILCSMISTYLLVVLGQFNMTAKKDNLVNATQIAYSTVMEYIDHEKNGLMTREEAQMAALEAVRMMRYGNEDYLWINSSEKMLMHPINKALEGVAINDGTFKDPDGKMFLVEAADLVKKDGEGFINYMWPKPGFNEPVEKISYVKSVDSWGWNIATGLYVNDVDAVTTLIQNTRIVVGIILAVIIIISALIIFSLNKSIIGLLNRITKKVGETTNFIVSSSMQLATASQQLAEGSTEQAASIEETSATMQQTSAMVTQNAENTRQASIISEDAYKSSKTGVDQMMGMNSSMQEIKKSSDDIAKIIKVIDDIAFQTNILALNAAVEAARAGDAGAGFAVVAEEVRNLAGRSAKAAKDTASMIEDNIELSGKGVDISSQVTKSLGEINVSIDKVNKLVSEIAAASEEQAKGTEQISKAINQVEQVTQQNASVAQESSASSEELQSQAEELKQMVYELNRFVHGVHAMNKEKSLSNDRNNGDGYKKYSNIGTNSKNFNSNNSSKYSSKSENIIPLDEDDGF